MLATANGQINELIGLFSPEAEETLSLPCPGREKLGDGTVAALALHTADSYVRIAGFLQATIQMLAARPSRHRIPGLHRVGSHGPPQHAEAGHDEGTHDGDYTAENVDVPSLLERLTAGRDAVRLLAELTDEQLDIAPPAGSFRFCDGQRTLEQVVVSLLKHQAHQIEAMQSAVT